MNGRVLAPGPGGLVAVCASLYLLHCPDGHGRCAHCGLGLLDCRTRRNAIGVLLAAQVDLAGLDRTAADRRRP